MHLEMSHHQWQLTYTCFPSQRKEDIKNLRHPSNTKGELWSKVQKKKLIMIATQHLKMKDGKVTSMKWVGNNENMKVHKNVKCVKQSTLWKDINLSWWVRRILKTALTCAQGKSLGEELREGLGCTTQCSAWGVSFVTFKPWHNLT